ncbi:MAG: TetR/AcrR family transcriptional regulator [Bacteroidaceae bacterium]|nr:TetR/AcrR family transcriptional regulator [Bacteroidaceae bacterium]
MKKGDVTRQKLLRDAFVLFSSNSYEKVSFSEMEKLSKTSRGSMIYYFKNKEGLFVEMLKTMIFNQSSVENVPTAYRQSLLSFYNYFLEVLERDRQYIASMGVNNMNKAMFFIEMSALANLSYFRETAIEWWKREKTVWTEVLEHAVATKEIKEDTNIELASEMFEKIYIGDCFEGVFKLNGADLSVLREHFDYLYSLVKNN